MAFQEDAGRIHTGHAAYNLSSLRQRALNLLSLGGWNEQYLPKVLSNWNVIALVYCPSVPHALSPPATIWPVATSSQQEQCR